MKIRALMLFVKDVQKVAQFYKKYFGMVRVGKGNEEYLELRAKNETRGVRLALHKARGKYLSGASSPAKIIFACKNVREQVKKFKAQGLKFGKVHEWNGIAFADTKDPEQNPVQISSRK